MQIDTCDMVCTTDRVASVGGSASVRCLLCVYHATSHIQWRLRDGARSHGWPDVCWYAWSHTHTHIQHTYTHTHERVIYCCWCVYHVCCGVQMTADANRTAISCRFSWACPSSVAHNAHGMSHTQTLLPIQIVCTQRCQSVTSHTLSHVCVCICIYIYI